jgi:tetratricopeptide (TPR) repeat protein
MSGKKKSKHHQSFSASDLVRIAEAKLERGDAEEAIISLRSAEAKFRQPATSAKKVSIPPHVLAAQAALPQLLARAHFAHSLIAQNPEQKLADLDEAVKYSPGDFHHWLAHGLCCMLMGAPQMAQTDFQKADQIQPGNELVIQATALGLLAKERVADAKELLEQIPVEKRNASWQLMACLVGNICSADTNVSENGWQFPLLEGMTALARGNYKAALEKLSDWPQFDRNPSDAEAAILATQIFYTGALSFIDERYQAAYNSFSEAQRLSVSHHIYLPWISSIDTYCHKIAQQVAATDLPLAVRCWQTILKTSPDDEAAKSNLSLANRIMAYRLWREGDTEGALAIWQEALQADSQNELLLKNLALGFEKLERKSEALRHWRALGRIWRQQFKQRSTEPGFKERLLKLEQHIIELMIETGQSENEIVVELEASLKFDPENLELRRQTAERMIEIGRPQQALKHLEIAERQEGASSELLTRKASAMVSLQRFAEADKVFERAIELDPSNALARQGQILLLDRQAERADDNGDLKRAIEIRLKQLAINPSLGRAMVHLGSIYFNLDQETEAFEWLKRVSATDPNNLQWRLAVGETYLENGYLEEAEKEFESATALEPTYKTLHDIAMIYLDIDEVKKAIKYFDRASDKADVEELIDLATHLLDANRDKDANRYLAKAKKLDPTHPIPYVIKAVSQLRNPFSILLGVKNPGKLRKELDIAERLALTHPQHTKDLELIRDLKLKLEFPLKNLRL